MAHQCDDVGDADMAERFDRAVVEAPETQRAFDRQIAIS